MDTNITRALLHLDAWLEDQTEPPTKEDVGYILNFIANRYCTDRKSFDEIFEACNKHLLGVI